MASRVHTRAATLPEPRVTGDGTCRVFGVDTEDAMSSDNITLVRAAKPAKKDLPAGKDIKGGALPPKGGIVNNDNITLVRAAKPAKKDLPAGKDIKGGIIRKPISNDSLTLVRAAKPAKKDLPAGTVIKGGKKATR